MDVPQEPAHPIPELSVTVTDDANEIRLVISGDLDVIGAPGFLDRIEELGPAMTGPVEVDLAAVEFLDGAGARALLRLHQVVTRSGHRIVLTSAGPAVALVFDLLGYPELLDTIADDDSL